MAKDYEEQLAAKLEEEKLEETNNTKEENPSQINGENKEDHLNCEQSETNDESKTGSFQDGDGSNSKSKPTNKQSSGVVEEKA